jgi:hypothetical protein
MTNAERDGNSVTTLLAVSNADGISPVVLWADPTTHRLLVSSNSSDSDLYATDFPGADIGAQVNAAYAALPSTGGTIIIPAGSYSQSTAILFTTASKPVLLKGDPAGAATLTWTGTGTSTALTLNVSKAITAGWGIQGLKFVGPSSAGSTVGIQLGGLGADDGKGAAGVLLRDVHVRGFGLGVLTGNNVFLMNMESCVINFCGVLFFGKGGAGSGATSWLVNGANTINSGENMRFTNCTFADAQNAIGGTSTADYAVDLQISGITDWNFYGCSFDDASLYLNMYGGQSNNVHIVNCHFENPGSFPGGGTVTAYNFIRCIGGTPGVTLDITTSTFVNDATTLTPTQFILNGGHLTLTGCVVAPNYGCSTVNSMVTFENANNTNTLTWVGFSDLSSGVTYIVGTISNKVDSGWVDGTVHPTTVTDAGLLTASNFNTVLDATTFAGSDIGAQINAAYAYANTLGLTQGCMITVPGGIFSFSTPIVFATNGQRVKLFGNGGGGEGTELRYTGSGAAITINTGIQEGSPFISHASGYGIFYIKLTGNNNASNSTQVGMYIGGTNGAAGCIIESCDIFGFGIGLETGANCYHFLCSNGVIRNNAKNVYINSASNSGEMMHFFNCFIVDVANNTPQNGFQVADYGAASLTITGGSIDDCQLAIGLQVSVTMTGVHMENPSSAYGSYTYITMADSSWSSLTITGGMIMNDQSGAAKPTNFISSNGATVILNGVTFFSNGGGTITNACVGGRFIWNGITNGSSCITNIASGFPYTYSGSNQTAEFYQLMRPYTAQTGTYGIATTDDIVDCTSGTFTATLPTAVGVKGKQYTIKNSGTGVITVATTSAQTIDGASTQTIGTQYAAITVISDGANWKIVA